MKEGTLMKKIVLATGSHKLDQIFKEVLEEGWIFNKYYIDERKYVIDTIKSESPDIIIIHEKLRSQLESELDKDKELIFLLKQIRIDFSDTRIVFLSQRNKNNRIFKKIIDLGIYDIFLNEIDGDEFKQRLEQKPSFNHILNILEEQEEEYKFQLKDEEEGIAEEESTSSTENSTNTKSKHMIPVFDDDMFDIVPPEVKKEIVLMDRVIGSIFISVLGIQKNAGTTHTALLIANYLKRLGVKVAIVEANPSNHFASIEYAYEGGNGYSSESSRFEIDGVMYYKSGDVYVHELVGQFDYILLDLGAYETCKWLDEFFRSHVQVIIGSGSEWKQKELYHFHHIYQQHDQTKWIYGIPFINSQVLSDIKKELRHEGVFPLPVHADPYQVQKETDTLLLEMLKEFLPSTKPKIQLTKFMFIGGVTLITVLIFIIAFVIFASR